MRAAIHRTNLVFVVSRRIQNGLPGDVAAFSGGASGVDWRIQPASAARAGTCRSGRSTSLVRIQQFNLLPMKPRSILLLTITALVTTFVILNWAVFVSPATLSLGFRDIEAPLGLVMLGLTVLVGVLLIGYSVYLRKAALIQAGRNAEELRTQRRLADEAEASRFTELRNYLEGEFRHLTENDATFRVDVRKRLDALENELHAGNHFVPPSTNEDATSSIDQS